MELVSRCRKNFEPQSVRRQQQAQMIPQEQEEEKKGHEPEEEKKAMVEAPKQIKHEDLLNPLKKV